MCIFRHLHACIRLSLYVQRLSLNVVITKDPKILDMIQKHTHTVKLTMYTRARTHTTMASSGNDQIYK